MKEPNAIQQLAKKPQTVPKIAPKLFVTLKNSPNINSPIRGETAAPFKLAPICTKLFPNDEIRKDKAILKQPQNNTISLFVRTLRLSSNRLKKENRHKKSVQIIDDWLFKEDETELNEAQKIAPRKKPPEPGMTSKLFKTKNGTIWFGFLIRLTGLVSGSQS